MEQPVSGCPWILNQKITTSNFSQERGSYFFAFLSIMIRSNLTTSVNKDMINVKHVNIIMIVSYVVIRHHLRFQLKRIITKGCVPSSQRPRITTYRIRLFAEKLYHKNLCVWISNQLLHFHNIIQIIGTLLYLKTFDHICLKELERQLY